MSLHFEKHCDSANKAAARFPGSSLCHCVANKRSSESAELSAYIADAYPAMFLKLTCKWNNKIPSSLHNNNSINLVSFDPEELTFFI